MDGLDNPVADSAERAASGPRSLTRILGLFGALTQQPDGLSLADLNALLEELVDFFAPQAQVLRVQLRLRKSDEPIIAWFDKHLKGEPEYWDHLWKGKG